eukprot:Trichotokara_eunicae@DN5192_c0_g2_i2.p1
MKDVMEGKWDFVNLTVTINDTVRNEELQLHGMESRFFCSILTCIWERSSSKARMEDRYDLRKYRKMREQFFNQVVMPKKEPLFDHLPTGASTSQERFVRRSDPERAEVQSWRSAKTGRQINEIQKEDFQKEKVQYFDEMVKFAEAERAERRKTIL